MTRAMHNPAPSAGDLALAMKETFFALCTSRLAAAITPEHKEHNVTLPLQLNTPELNMTRAAKGKGKSCSLSNLALVFQMLIGSPNRVRTQRTTRAAQ